MTAAPAAPSAPAAPAAPAAPTAPIASGAAPTAPAAPAAPASPIASGASVIDDTSALNTARAAQRLLTIHIISDSIGDTAATIAAAAATQFANLECIIRRLPNVESITEIKDYIKRLIEEDDGREIVIFYTLANQDTVAAFKEFISDKDVYAVDLISPAINTIAAATNEEPLGAPGLIRKTDKEYFARVGAMEFAVDHDDGRNPEQLKSADIVLIGSSRTSKTPLSIYLAMHGYRVANVPLIPEVTAPKELFDLDPARVFGLMSQAQLLSEIRYQRLGNAASVAGSYAEPANVQRDLDEARALMRRIGCIVVRTDNRAIEETAQEILRYYEAAFPSHKPPIKQYY